MTNFEKHKEQLLEIANVMDTGIAVRNGELYPCEKLRCEDCDFYGDGSGSCEARLVRWLYEEYQEKPKLSERAYHFLRSLPNNVRIRISDGRLYMKRLYMKDKESIVDVYYNNNEFIPFLPLKPDLWYEVSEILKWEVE